MHKGLDLTLEAFAAMPEYRLTVCGPVAADPRFREAYRRELFELPNIDTADWVDIGSARFREITDRSLGVVYPSCSEGGGGSVVTCMQAGLIPVVTRQASVDVDDAFGVVLRGGNVEAIRESVTELAERPAEELERMARRAWRTARTTYTRERYAAAFRSVMESVLLRHPVAEPARVAVRRAV